MPWISDKDLKRAQEWLGDPTVTVSVGPEGVGPEGVKPVTPPTSNPSAMSQELSEEKLREILDGCEGVTPGPWGAAILPGSISMGEDIGFIVGPVPVTRDKMCGYLPADATHIGRLDPQTVAALVTALLSAQRKNEELVRAGAELREWIDLWDKVCAAADPDDDADLPSWEEVVKTALPDWNASHVPSAEFWSGYMQADLVYKVRDFAAALRSISEEK